MERNHVEALARRAKRGDKVAFAELVEGHQRVVFALACQHTPDKSEAEDVAQDAFLRAYRDLRKLRNPASFTAWLYGITVNVAREYGRKRRPAVPLDSIPEPVADSADTGEQERIAALMAMVADLPDEYRIALTMRYVDGLSYRDIGQALSIQEVSARSRVYRAREMLRTAVHEN